METKDSYLRKMKAKFDDLNYKWKTERNNLEAKAQHAKVEVRKKFEQSLITFQQRRDQMRQKLEKYNKFIENQNITLFMQHTIQLPATRSDKY